MIAEKRVNFADDKRESIPYSQTIEEGLINNTVKEREKKLDNTVLFGVFLLILAFLLIVLFILMIGRLG
uniref:Uncharacterized protein n=1 Tax=Acrobeloides nanus TaxID=290746 RepID=A0A914E3F2_9BILA